MNTSYFRRIREIERPTQAQVLEATGYRTELVTGMESLWLAHFGEDGPGLHFDTERYMDIDRQYGWLSQLQPWAQEEFTDLLLAGMSDDDEPSEDAITNA